MIGAYEVACNGDFANWKVKGAEGRRHRRRDGSRGLRQAGVRHPGARTRDGAPRLVERCALPVTARGVVTLVATNYGLFEPTGNGFLLREIAPGLTVEQIRASTAGKLTVAENLRTVWFGA